MRHVLAVTLAALWAAPTNAGECPPLPDRSQELAELIAAARDAPDARAGRRISDEMWEIWADAPDAYAQDLLDEGMTRREAHDFAGAMDAFDALVEYCPHYAEGYNQRAFVNFLRQDYEAALPDLDRTLELSPRHVAALTGKALTLAALDRKGEAALTLRKALEFNPWLGERHLLPVLEAAEEEI
ncbi:tetratricopeptide repeat protein [Roseovarius salis]|uniref:tetratricopeptide repeat protein n=1 Tax=Roseovarius salis TaxID=3376063 RepID=UPI0037C6F5AA